MGKENPKWKVHRKTAIPNPKTQAPNPTDRPRRNQGAQEGEQ